MLLTPGNQRHDPLDSNDTTPGTRARAATRISVAQLANMLNARIADRTCNLLGNGHERRLACGGEFVRTGGIQVDVVTGLLRRKLGFDGAVITDDIDMDAIRDLMSRKEAFVRALAAGNDLIMIKNLFGYDPLLPQRAVRWVREAIAAGTLSEAQIMAAVDRVQAIRRWVGTKQG